MGATLCHKPASSTTTGSSARSIAANTANGSTHEPVLQSLDSMSDEQLVDMYRTGDQKAFDALIRRYERPIYNLAYRLARNHDDAQEIVGEAYLRICLNLHLIQHAVTLRAWMNRIVANIYINMRRRVKRTRAESLDALEEKAGDA